MTGAGASSAGAPLLEIEDLHGWYGESHVLHGVSLRVNEGEVVSLLGRNGAGRTTTLRAVTGLLGRREGSIRLRGAETTRMASHRIARLGVGYVPEERGIFATLTTAENLVLPPVVAGGGMSVEAIHDLFPNLKERARSPGTRLSGGEQQMLAIARVLRTGARLLLLDEISEGLAPVIVQALARLVERLKAEGFTVLMVEQNFRFAAPLADRFYVMEHGRVALEVDKRDLEARQGEIDAYLSV